MEGMNAIGVLANNETDEWILPAIEKAVKNFAYANEEAKKMA